MRRSGRDGFTLIELLVVVAIIGIIASLGVPSIRGARTKAGAKEAQMMLQMIGAYEMDYRLEHRGFLPAPVNPATIPAGCYEGQDKGKWQYEGNWKELGIQPVGGLCFQYEVKIEGAEFVALASTPLFGGSAFELRSGDFEVKRK